LREVNERGWSLTTMPITADHMAELLTLIGKDVISGKIAKTVFEEMVEKGGKPKEIVDRLGLVQVSDEGAITALVAKVIDANPGPLADYLGGRDKLFGFFVGQVMKESGGKMNPGLVNKILQAQLDARKKS
jgi:aspartyl-tRNA(Asn)/glutamyl-tRNA(Gln) amidotransferase subunit B